MKFLKSIGWLAAILLISFIIAIYFFHRTTVTPNSGVLKAKGLAGAVIITRDSHGVPHIDAKKSDLDAFFALGYVHAQDRFWQMEFQRRVASGTLSEIFGPKTLEKDKYLRTWGFYRAAQIDWFSLSPQAHQIIQAYTNGVNAFLAQKHYPLPIKLLNYQPRPWTVIDSMVWQKMMAWDLQNVWKQKLENALVVKEFGASQVPVLFPPYPKDAPVIVSNVIPAKAGIQPSNVANDIRNDLGFTDSPGIGSNNWVVSGKLTTTGKPMLANDPHLGLQAPALWYLAELKGPTLHVIGATLPGIPGVVLGRNDHIAWGATNAKPDTQELYILNDQTPVKTLHEIIKVKGKPDVHFDVQMSGDDPVIQKNIALHWTALLPKDTTVQSMLEINYAQNWSQFTQALKTFVVPSQNFVYADTDGNIGYYMPGNVPIRKGWSGAVPVPLDEAHQWSGYVPFEKLPHLYNPTNGIIATANNKVVGNDYPYQLTFRWDHPPYRVERILSLLNHDKPLSMQKMQAIQNDVVSVLWRDNLAPLLLQTKPTTAESARALKQLKTWNGDSSLSSVPTTIFAYWYRELSKLTPKSLREFSEWPEPLFITQQLKDNGVYCQTEGAKNCHEFLSQSLARAMRSLVNDLGDNPKRWRWEYVHRAKFIELGIGQAKSVGWIWNRSIATPGSYYTINVGTYRQKDFVQTDGPSYREIIDLSNLNNSLYIQTMGQSNDPFSKNYSNLMDLWRRGKYIPMSSDQKDWGSVDVLHLVP